MESLKKYCPCGWEGSPHIKHSYEEQENSSFKDCMLHTESRHCKSCGSEIDSVQNIIRNSQLNQKEKQDLGIKQISLPYEFSTTKYELEIFEDKFTIYSKDITDATRLKNYFRSKNKVECIGEIFYEIILNPGVPGDSFIVEYRITDSEIDAFCGYFLEHTAHHRAPVQPRVPFNPGPISPYPPIPPSNPFNPSPQYPAFDPNQFPWKQSPSKKTDPYADANDFWKKLHDNIGSGNDIIDDLTSYLDENKKPKKNK